MRFKIGDKVTYRDFEYDIEYDCVIVGYEIIWGDTPRYDIKEINGDWSNSCTDGTENNNLDSSFRFNGLWSLEYTNIGMIKRNILKHEF